jgi:hypothetical protein
VCIYVCLCYVSAQDDPEGKYALEYKTNFCVAWDEKKQLMTRFGAVLTRSIMVCHSFLIDSRGIIVWHQNHSQIGSTVPTFINVMAAAVEAVMNGQPVPSVGSKEVAEPEESDEEEDMGGMGSF